MNNMDLLIAFWIGLLSACIANLFVLRHYHLHFLIPTIRLLWYQRDNGSLSQEAPETPKEFPRFPRAPLTQQDVDNLYDQIRKQQ